MTPHPTIPGVVLLDADSLEYDRLQRQGRADEVWKGPCTHCPHFTLKCEFARPGVPAADFCTAGRGYVWAPLHLIVAARLEGNHENTP